MVNVVDRIQYLPKDRSSILDVNEIMNKAYRMVVDRIKERTRRVDTKGNRATVTVTGRVQKNQTNTKFNVSVECEDEEVKQAIAKAIKG
jgi:hypothetical protein